MKKLILCVFLLSGCVTVTPANVKTVSHVDLCEESVNGQPQPYIDAEIKSRKIDCGPILQYAAADKSARAQRAAAGAAIQRAINPPPVYTPVYVPYY